MILTIIGTGLIGGSMAITLREKGFAERIIGVEAWVGIPAKYKDGYALSDEVLYNSNVFITPGGIFGSAGDKYIRVSLCGSVEKFEEAKKRIGN